MKLSICIFAYNLEKFIAQAIESALSQVTDFEYEIVIGEDCSKDSTREIASPDKHYVRKADKNRRKQKKGPTSQYRR